MASLFQRTFIRHWAERGESYADIALMLKRLRPDEPLTPHDVLMLLLEMSNEHQRESESGRHGDAGTGA
jgi:hypothetical protein